MKVYNLSRQEARQFCEKGDFAWISIGEPTERDGSSFKHISNNILDRGPKLKIKFWDLTQKVDYIGHGHGEYLYPPDKDDAQEIVDFILANPKDLIVNCAAGISRSGAVALFCQDVLGYEWGYCKNRAVPNMHLYKLMREYFEANPSLWWKQ